MKRRDVFITGTDTDVGKTWVAIRLIRHLRATGVDAVGMKPIECGGDDDSRALLEACRDSGITQEEVNPISFPEPLAPAAMSDGAGIDFADLVGFLDRLRDRHERVIVEGAGGWLVPVDGGRTMADLAIGMGLPVVVVAANRLGVLNHTLLTCRAVEAAGLEVRAVFLNDAMGKRDHSSESNAGVLRHHLAGVSVIENELAALADVL